jgi:hypothetical protein
LLGSGSAPLYDREHRFDFDRDPSGEGCETECAAGMVTKLWTEQLM